MPPASMALLADPSAVDSRLVMVFSYAPPGPARHMRWTLALVPLLMLSGCLSSSPADEPATDGTGDDTPTSDNDGLRQGVVFYNEPYQALPNEPLEFMVNVPEGARNVKLEMSVTGAATPLDEAVVSLAGCGQGFVTWNPGPNVNIVVSGGGSWREADLCSAAGAGSRSVNIDTGATPMAGQILLRADLP